MKKLIIYFFAFLIFTLFVNAFSVKSFNTEIEIYDDGVAKVTNKLIFNSEGINNVVEIPTYNPESIIVRDKNSDLKFATLEDKIVVKPRFKHNNYEINIQYLTNSIVSKKEDVWHMSYSIPGYSKFGAEEMEQSAIIISLPNTAIIMSSTNKDITFFESGNLKTGGKLNLDYEENTNVEISYKNKTINRLNWFKILFYGLILIMGLFLVFFVFKYGYGKLNNVISKGKKDIIKTLNDNQKEVIKLLLNNKNKLYQRKIQKETDISKATLSRTIKCLNQKEIIEIKPRGNTNLILLKGWFVKK